MEEDIHDLQEVQATKEPTPSKYRVPLADIEATLLDPRFFDFLMWAVATVFDRSVAWAVHMYSVQQFDRANLDQSTALQITVTSETRDVQNCTSPSILT